MKPHLVLFTLAILSLPAGAQDFAGGPNNVTESCGVPDPTLPADSVCKKDWKESIERSIDSFSKASERVKSELIQNIRDNHREQKITLFAVIQALSNKLRSEEKAVLRAYRKDYQQLQAKLVSLSTEERASKLADFDSKRKIQIINVLRKALNTRVLYFSSTEGKEAKHDLYYLFDNNRRRPLSSDITHDGKGPLGVVISKDDLHDVSNLDELRVHVTGGSISVETLSASSGTRNGVSVISEPFIPVNAYWTCGKGFGDSVNMVFENRVRADLSLMDNAELLQEYRAFFPSSQSRGECNQKTGKCTYDYWEKIERRYGKERYEALKDKYYNVSDQEVWSSLGYRQGDAETEFKNKLKLYRYSENEQLLRARYKELESLCSVQTEAADGGMDEVKAEAAQ